MKVFKLVAGIICIVLSVMVMLQSCAAGAANILSENGEVSGSGGFLVAIFLLAGGIIMITTRNARGTGGGIAAVIVFILGAALGFAVAGSFTDLRIWAGLSLVLAVINLIFVITAKRKQ